MAPLHIEKITLFRFKSILSRYPATVPEKLRDLDTARYDTIPASVAARESKYLTKDEVVRLVEWKLKHGTFRPALLALVTSNSDEVVEETTGRAWNALSNPPHVEPLPALKILSGLKGVGPATASLLLSVMRPREVPFFSDEVFRWCVWDEGDGEGWKRKIKYNIKEYEMVFKKVEALRSRLGKGEMGAAEVEKVAWVLGQEGVDVDGGEEDQDAEEMEDAEAHEQLKETVKSKEKDTAEKPAAKKGTKRKATEIKTPAEGTRKSSRTKR